MKLSWLGLFPKSLTPWGAYPPAQIGGSIQKTPNNTKSKPNSKC